MLSKCYLFMFKIIVSVGDFIDIYVYSVVFISNLIIGIKASCSLSSVNTIVLRIGVISVSIGFVSISAVLDSVTGFSMGISDYFSGLFSMIIVCSGSIS